ncbi:ABC transporter permease [Herbiconiux sp.]|uniref:ABC transporter permease n=1 Tax=Herbiconiux sp. TaxID=1871186 RepID=UPI0025C48606|nr:ABC transporter permease [Herbiconiux sp.]
MSAFWRGVGLIMALELKQRVRGVAWYVILGIFFVLVGLVTIGGWVITGFGHSSGVLFSSIVYFVLLLASLISPALSGNAINGEREGGTLATIQVTSITTAQIVIGKWLAAWLASLVLLVATLPFLGIVVAIGDVSAATVASSLAVLTAELGILSAFGVGLSGLIRNPVFSVVVSYLLVAALSLGTLIAFSIAGSVTQVTVSSTSIEARYDSDGDYLGCGAPSTSTYTMPRFDPYWGLLVVNPYVVVADASTGDFDEGGQPLDLFGFIAVAVRQAQIMPDTDPYYDYCVDSTSTSWGGPEIATGEELMRSGAPSWFIGLGLQTVLAGLALFGAWRATRTPSGRLASGSRMA